MINYSFQTLIMVYYTYDAKYADITWAYRQKKGVSSGDTRFLG